MASNKVTSTGVNEPKEHADASYNGQIHTCVQLVGRSAEAAVELTEHVPAVLPCELPLPGLAMHESGPGASQEAAAGLDDQP